MGDCLQSNTITFFVLQIGNKYFLFECTMKADQSLSPIVLRNGLKDWVQKFFETTNCDIFINELGFYNKNPNSSVDTSYRADLALANGRLVGFEIKSEKDTLKRWESQKWAYTNVFDEVWLCVHAKHIQEALINTPKHIGIILADNFGNFTIVRKAVSNHGLNNIYDLSGLLWREELNELLKKYSIHVKSRTTKREVREILENYLSLYEVRDFTLQKIKMRKVNLDN